MLGLLLTRRAVAVGTVQKRGLFPFSTAFANSPTGRPDQRRFKSSGESVRHVAGIKNPPPPPRATSYTADMKEFSRSLLESVSDVYDATDPSKSSIILRRLVKTKLLLYTDMRDAPEKFFLAHRLLSTIGYIFFRVCMPFS